MKGATKSSVQKWFTRLRQLPRACANKLSFSGLIIIISSLLVANIYISLYGDQLATYFKADDTGESGRAFLKSLIYFESGACFVALIGLYLWFSTLRSRLFDLIDAARRMIRPTRDEDENTGATPGRRREDVFAEMDEIAEHMRSLHARMLHFAELNSSINAMLDSLGQGFLVFGKDGVCLPIFSKACLDLFGTSPQARAVSDLLGVPDAEKASFGEWIQVLFDEKIPFEDLALLGPNTLLTPAVTAAHRHVELEFRPVRNPENRIEGVVLIATDRTRERDAELAAEQSRNLASMIVKLAQEQRTFSSFVDKANELVETLTRSASGARAFDRDFLFREAHTLKGIAGILYVKKVADLCHELEGAIQQAPENGGPQMVGKFVRFAAEIGAEIRQIVDDYGSLFGRESSARPVTQDSRQDTLDFYRLLERLEKNGTASTAPSGDVSTAGFGELRKLREVFFGSFVSESLRSVLGGFESRVQEIAQNQGKQVAAFRFEGADVRILREGPADLCLSFVHLFTNAIDHGIETPEERLLAGKSAAASIVIGMRRAKDKQGQAWIVLSISDDGRGISPAAIRAKLTAKGYDSGAESDHRVIQHVFDAEFSTREIVNEYSGRGVGLGAVRVEVEKLGGFIEVTPATPYGTTFFVKIPEQALTSTHTDAAAAGTGAYVRAA